MPPVLDCVEMKGSFTDRHTNNVEEECRAVGESTHENERELGISGGREEGRGEDGDNR